jgi:hypothetical protein
MKCTVLLLFSLLLLSCKSTLLSEENQKKSINVVLDNWHKAAADAKFEPYFSTFDKEAVFIGTDATENWNRKAFESFSKPYFDKGKAWSFTALERNIYFSENKKTAWFDELLQTQMKICRGSGVLVQTSSGWKIKHYVLSMTVPNDTTDEVVKIKTSIEDKIIEQLQKK